MYQVYKSKDGKPVLAVRVRERGNLTEKPNGIFTYSEYPSQVSVKAKEVLWGDYIVQTEKGNELVVAESFEETYSPQATFIG